MSFASLHSIRQPGLAFGPTSGSLAKTRVPVVFGKRIEEPDPTRRISRLQKTFWGMSWAALALTLTGAGTLMASYIPWGIHKVQHASPYMAAPVGAAAPQNTTLHRMVDTLPGETAIVKADAEMKSDLLEIHEHLKQMGLMGILMGIGAGCLSEIGVGLRHRQKTLTTANALFLCLAPFLANESAFFRGLFLVLMGTYYAGYANIVEKLARKTPGDKTPATGIEPKKHLIKYLIDDHVLVLSAGKKGVGELKGMVKDVLKAVRQLSRHEKVNIQPTADRTRISSLCHYLGGGILIASQSRPWLGTLGAMIAAIGSLPFNMDGFSIGTQREDWIGKALKIGMPIQAIGKGLFYFTVGFGLEQMGQAASYALSTELNNPYQQPGLEETKGDEKQ